MIGKPGSNNSEILGDPPLPPLEPLLTAGDPTIEGLIKAWPNAHAALGIFSAEGGQFIGGYGMQHEHALKSAAAFSELWDGLPIKRVRALDGVSVIYGRRLSVHLLVQPDAAAKFLANPTLRDQGILSRILVAAPETIAGTRFYRDTKPEDDAAIARLGGRLMTIVEAPWPLKDGRNELEPREIVLSPAAKALWIDFFNEVERELGRECRYRPIGDFGAKAAEQAARIAGVMAVIDSTFATEITAETMANAITVMRWYLGEAIRLQQAGRTDPKLVLADEVMKFIKTHGGEIRVHDLIRSGPVAVRNKSTALEVVAILKNYGWLTEVSKRPHTVRLV